MTVKPSAQTIQEVIRGKITQGVIESTPQKFMAEGHPTQVVAEIELEARGGACLLCGDPYAKVKVSNRFAEFVYYKPTCRCYRICDRVAFEVMRGNRTRTMYRSGCGRRMVVEKLMALGHCTNCGGKIPGKRQQEEKGEGGEADFKKATAGDRD